MGINEKIEFNKIIMKNIKSYLGDYDDVSSIKILGDNISKKPKITIAIPTYKRTFFLNQAIKSILNQKNFNDYEILVIDNDPNRNCETEHLLIKYQNSKIRYYKNSKNIGMYGNWNRCISLSNSKYLTILNDDDTLNQNFLKDTFEFINKHKKNDALNVRYNYIDENSNVINKQKNFFKSFEKVFILQLFFGNINPGSLGTVFLKKKMIQIGGFDESYFPSSDYEFNLRFISRFKNVYVLNKYLSNYRLAVNECQKLETLNNFLVKDHQIRLLLIEKFSFIKNILKNSLTVITYGQYIEYSNNSNEFKEVNSVKMNNLKNEISYLNKISAKVAYFIFRISKLYYQLK